MVDEELRHRFVQGLKISLALVLLAFVLVPISGVGAGDDDQNGAATVERRLLGTLTWAWSVDPADLGSTKTHPIALDGGVWFLRLGFLLVTIGVLALVGVLARWPGDRMAEPPPRTPAYLTAAAVTVVVGLLLALLGTRWLPDDEVRVALQPAAVLGLVAAVWAGFLARSTDLLLL